MNLNGNVTPDLTLNIFYFFPDDWIRQEGLSM